MANSTIKIDCKDYNIEIEGLEEFIYRIFSDLRQFGFSSVSKIEFSNENTEAVQPEVEEVKDNIRHVPEQKPLPDLNLLILERRRFTQSQWMLLMAWFCSHNGKIFFSKKDIKKMYTTLKKYTKMKSGDFSSFFIQLIYNNHITKVDSDSFELSRAGYNKAVDLLRDKNSDDSSLMAEIG